MEGFSDDPPPEEAEEADGAEAVTPPGEEITPTCSTEECVTLPETAETLLTAGSLPDWSRDSKRWELKAESF
jgi:hypothetical protein